MIQIKEINRNNIESEFSIDGSTIKLNNNDIYNYIKNLQYTDDIIISTLEGQTKTLYKIYN